MSESLAEHDADIGDMDFACERNSGGIGEPSLRRDEGHGMRGEDGWAERFALITIQARWNVYSQHTFACGVDLLDNAVEWRAQRPCQPGAKYGVDDPVGLCEHLSHFVEV